MFDEKTKHKKLATAISAVCNNPACASKVEGADKGYVTLTLGKNIIRVQPPKKKKNEK